MPAPNVIDQMREDAIIGAIFVSVAHFVKGVCTSPNGSRLAGGFLAVPENALAVGRWAAWFGVVKATRCTVQHVSPGYPFESTVALGVTDTLFSMHHGPRVALRNGLRYAAIGGVLDMVMYSLKRSACAPGIPATQRRV
ncbi:mitochondrial import inner membrane translocase subunit TIM17-2-like [Aegilops tauschii subsp. strangulata]|uniref:Uncharacterized protein n=1 Tax=Aegilops tauschii TaxID=37682 RepID=M8BJ68_AEGTA|nr:mitochondrial import inner membrane translocase subunit TIM17-2-like [Aegilops tauschii subsp. strangulata]